MAVDLSGLADGATGWAAPLRAALIDLDMTKIDETVASATYASRGEVRSQVKTDGTDQTATLNAEMVALNTAGGGTLVLPIGRITCEGTFTLPTDGASPVPTVNPLRLLGQGAQWAARSATPPTGGTILDIKGTDTYGKIKTNGVGIFSAEGVTFTDSAGTDTPFLYTTNTTLHVQRCAFMGTKNWTACDQDAIICGGINQVEGGSAWTDGFQGYGTVISRNYFNHIRRAVFGRAFFNSNVIRDNTVWNQCGSNLADGACIEIDGQPSGASSALGNKIQGNLIEAPAYPYSIKLTQAQGNIITGNDTWDHTATTLAAIRFEHDASNNYIIHGWLDAAVDGVSEATPGLIEVNLVVNPNMLGGTTNFPWTTRFARGLETNAIIASGIGTPEILLYASAALPNGIYVLGNGSPNGQVVANVGSLCIVKHTSTNISVGTGFWVKVSDALTSTGWVPIGSRLPVTTKTVDYSLTADDAVVLSNGTSLTMYLPLPVGEIVGRTFTVKNIAATACTVSAPGTNIDGAPTATLAQWTTGRYINDGTFWYSI